MTELQNKFPLFLDRALAEAPLKGEYFLPNVVGSLLKEEKATVKVLHTPDKWYGVTYREDKPSVAAALQHMQRSGIYPEELWESDPPACKLLTVFVFNFIIIEND